MTPATVYNAVALQQPDGALLTERNHDLADIISQSVVVECDFPIAPREGYDRDTQRAIDALFGRPAREVAIDEQIFSLPSGQSDN